MMFTLLLLVFVSTSSSSPLCPLNFGVDHPLFSLNISQYDCLAGKSIANDYSVFSSSTMVSTCVSKDGFLDVVPGIESLASNPPSSSGISQTTTYPSPALRLFRIPHFSSYAFSFELWFNAIKGTTTTLQPNANLFAYPGGFIDASWTSRMVLTLYPFGSFSFDLYNATGVGNTSQPNPLLAFVVGNSASLLTKTYDYRTILGSRNFTKTYVRFSYDGGAGAKLWLGDASSPSFLVEVPQTVTVSTPSSITGAIFDFPLAFLSPSSSSTTLDSYNFISFTVWDQEATTNDTLHRFLTTYPTSVPVVKNGSFTYLQGLSEQILSIGAYIYDFDNGSTTTTILSWTGTTKGVLLDNGTAISTFPHTLVGGGSLLTFRPYDIYAYSLEQGSLCNASTTAFYSFSFIANKNISGILYSSPSTGTYTVCVQDIPDPPSIEDYPLFASVQNGGSVLNFTLDPVDPDDYRIPLSPYRSHNLTGALVNGSMIMFNGTNGTYGYIGEFGSDGQCYKNTTIGIFIPPPYTYCYKTYVSNLPAFYGPDTFYFKFRDAYNISLGWSSITINVTEPITAQVNDSRSLNEFPYNGTFTPKGVDTYHRGMLLRVRFLTFPKNGSIYVGGSLFLLNESVPFGENLTYIPSIYYFNRLSGSRFTDGLGNGINGCPLKSFPGCPDTATFEIFDPSAGGDVSSNRGTISFYVDGTYTPLLPPTVPSPGFLASRTTTSLTVQINDVDDDMYNVGIQIAVTSPGLLSSIYPLALQTSPYVTFVSCTLEFDSLLFIGCGDVAMFGLPSIINQVLAQLTLSMSHSRDPNGSLWINVYKTQQPQLSSNFIDRVTPSFAYAIPFTVVQPSQQPTEPEPNFLDAIEEYITIAETSIYVVMSLIGIFCLYGAYRFVRTIAGRNKHQKRPPPLSQEETTRLVGVVSDYFTQHKMT